MRTLNLALSTFLLLALSACHGGTADSATSSSSGSSSSGSSSSGGSTDLSDLTPPPTGQGVQFETDDIEVPAGTEQQNCYFFKVKDLIATGGITTSAINLHHVQVALRAGSHHMNLFQVKTIVALGPATSEAVAVPSLGPDVSVVRGTNGSTQCFVSSNWADWPLIANSQIDGSVDWTFPDGVVNTLDPTTSAGDAGVSDDTWLMLQVHYVNAATQMTQSAGHVRVNFWSVPDNEITYQMGTIFATKQSIAICESNPTPTFAGSCQINSPNPVKIIAANGHFHSRGKVFDMYSWDGTSTTTPAESAKFYTSTAWNDPPMPHSPALDLAVPAMQGIWYSCSYEWVMPPPSIGCAALNTFDAAKHPTDPQNDCCYTFGPQVDKNEHCNAFVYYYPKADDVHCE